MSEPSIRESADQSIEDHLRAAERSAVHLEMPRPQIAALTIFSTAAVIGLGLVAAQERPFSPPLEVTPEPLQDIVRETPDADITDG